MIDRCTPDEIPNVMYIRRGKLAEPADDVIRDANVV
jgi:hypothetical protein